MDERTLPCAVFVDGPLGDGVLIPGQTYRVVEVREHWEPSPNEGEPPHISTIIRFDPASQPTATLRGALDSWLQHKMNCASTEGYGVRDGQRLTPQKPCDCGLDAALATPSDAREEELRAAAQAFFDHWYAPTGEGRDHRPGDSCKDRLRAALAQDKGAGR